MVSRFSNASLRRLGHLFAGADAGFFTLPQRVVDARTAIERLAAEADRVRQQPARMTDLDLVDRVVAAASAGKKFPSAAELAAAEQDRHTRDLYAHALARAVEGVENQLENAALGSAESIIAEHLRPALDEVMAEVAELAALLAPYGTAPKGLLQAPDEVRLASVRFDAVAARYRALRDAQGALGSLREQPADAGRLFEVRNYSALTAGYRPGKVPWSTDDTTDKLVWFVTNGAQVWMPTPEERTAVVEAEAEAAKSQHRKGTEVPA